MPRHLLVDFIRGRGNWMKKYSTKRLERRSGFLFVLPAVAYFLIVYTYPFIQTFFMSFFSDRRGSTNFIGFANYHTVFSDSVFWLSFWNTLKLALFSVPMTVVIAIVIALLLNSLKSKTMRNVLQITCLLPMMVSLVAAALIFQWIFDPVFGILNTLLQSLGIDKQPFFASQQQVIPSLAVISIWLRVGFSATILLAGLQSIPVHYYEAAYIDGATPTISFFKITLPLLNPQIVLVCITEIIFALKAFEQVYITTSGGPINSSRIIVLHLYETAFLWNKYHEASAIAIILFVFLMIVSIFQWVFLRKKTD